MTNSKHHTDRIMKFSKKAVNIVLTASMGLSVIPFSAFAENIPPEKYEQIMFQTTIPTVIGTYEGISNIDVTLLTADGTYSQRAKSDENGYLTFYDVPVSEYTVQIDHEEDVYPFTTTIETVTDTETAIPLELTKRDTTKGAVHLAQSYKTEWGFPYPRCREGNFENPDIGWTQPDYAGTLMPPTVLDADGNVYNNIVWSVRDRGYAGSWELGSDTTVNTFYFDDPDAVEAGQKFYVKGDELSEDTSERYNNAGDGISNSHLTDWLEFTVDENKNAVEFVFDESLGRYVYEPDPYFFVTRTRMSFNSENRREISVLAYYDGHLEFVNDNGREMLNLKEGDYTFLIIDRTAFRMLDENLFEDIEKVKEALDTLSENLYVVENYTAHDWKESENYNHDEYQSINTAIEGIIPDSQLVRKVNVNLPKTNEDTILKNGEATIDFNLWCSLEYHYYTRDEHPEMPELKIHYNQGSVFSEKFSEEWDNGTKYKYQFNIPEDAKSIENMTLTFPDGTEYNIPVNMEIVSHVKMAFTGNSVNLEGKTLTVSDNAGNTVYAHKFNVYQSAENFVWDIGTLPEGDYTASLTEAKDKLVVNYGETAFTVGKCEDKTTEFEIVADISEPAEIFPSVKNSDGNQINGEVTFKWYADKNGKTLLSNEKSCVIQPKQTVYLLVEPADTAVFQYQKSDYIPVTSGDELLSVTLKDTEKSTASGKVLNGSAPVEGVNVILTVSTGEKSVSRNGWTNSDGSFIIEDVPKLENAVYSLLATQRDINDVSMNIENLNDISVAVSSRTGVITMQNGNTAVLTNADGDVIPFTQYEDKLYLTSTEQVKAGEKIHVQVLTDGGYSETDIVLNKNKNAVIPEVTFQYYTQLELEVKNRYRQPVVLLKYRDNTLESIDKDSFANDPHSTVYQEHDISKGKYTYLFVQETAFKQYGKELLSNLAEAQEKLRELGENVFVSCEFEVQDNITDKENAYKQISVDLSDVTTPEFSGIMLNRSASGLNVTADSKKLSSRITVSPKSKDGAKSVTLNLYTNQTTERQKEGQGNPDLISGSLYINGIRVKENDFYRGNPDDNPEKNVSMTTIGDHQEFFEGIYSLTIKDVSQYGGYPLTVKWETGRINPDGVTATATVAFNTENTGQQYIDETAVSDNSLSFTMPEKISQDEFTVNIPNVKKDSTITLYCNNTPIATTNTGTYTSTKLVASLKDTLRNGDYEFYVTMVQPDGKTSVSEKKTVSYSLVQPVFSKIWASMYDTGCTPEYAMQVLLTEQGFYPYDWSYTDGSKDFHWYLSSKPTLYAVKLGNLDAYSDPENAVKNVYFCFETQDGVKKIRASRMKAVHDDVKSYRGQCYDKEDQPCEAPETGRNKMDQLDGQYFLSSYCDPAVIDGYNDGIYWYISDWRSVPPTDMWVEYEVNTPDYDYSVSDMQKYDAENIHNYFDYDTFAFDKDNAVLTEKSDFTKTENNNRTLIEGSFKYRVSDITGSVVLKDGKERTVTEAFDVRKILAGEYEGKSAQDYINEWKAIYQQELPSIEEAVHARIEDGSFTPEEAETFLYSVYRDKYCYKDTTDEDGWLTLNDYYCLGRLQDGGEIWAYLRQDMESLTYILCDSSSGQIQIEKVDRVAHNDKAVPVHHAFMTMTDEEQILSRWQYVAERLSDYMPTPCNSTANSATNEKTISPQKILAKGSPAEETQVPTTWFGWHQHWFGNDQEKMKDEIRKWPLGIGETIMDFLEGVFSIGEHRSGGITSNSGGKNKQKSKVTLSNALLDPSGFIYEGVPSNRVSGVRAELYEVADDGSRTLWNAEAFEQTNPVFSDAYGVYQWVVPSGKWSVSFAKYGYADYMTGENDGYHAQLSGETWYMPVSPEQLDVNINLFRTNAPEIVSAQYYKNVAFIVFDQYMDIKTLTADKFTLSYGDTDKNITADMLSFPDAEKNNSETYARTVKITLPETVSAEGELRISSKVYSYTGKGMESDVTVPMAYQPDGIAEAKAPQINMESGDISEIVVVSLTSEEENAVIFYTTDGSTPTTASNLYTGGVEISGDTVLKAVSVVPGRDASEIAVTDYTFIVPETETREPEPEPETKESETTETEPTETKKLTSVERLCEMSLNDYEKIMKIRPASAEGFKNEDGTVSVYLYDTNGEILDIYRLNPETRTGTGNQNRAINLPQTGNNSGSTAATATGASALTIAGIFLALKSSIFRRKKK